MKLHDVADDTIHQRLSLSAPAADQRTGGRGTTE
jgi:hypothetical protein